VSLDLFVTFTCVQENANVHN